MLSVDHKLPAIEIAGQPRVRRQEAQTFEFGGFRLDVAQRQLVTIDGGSIDLPSRAFDLLLYMVERPGELLSKSALLKGVWPTTVVEEGNLSQCIYALRRALGDATRGQRFIATVPGRGYQFVAQVRKVIVSDQKLPSKIATAPSGRLRERRALWIICGINALALIGLFAMQLWPRTSAMVLRPSSVAILPLSDFSPARDMKQVTDGIAKKLMNSLSTVDSLRVIGRGSEFSFLDGNDDARAIGAKLNVESLIEGSVRRSGERIRISVRLVRAHDGLSLWSRTYDLKPDDVLDTQSAIASEVTAYLHGPKI